MAAVSATLSLGGSAFLGGCRGWVGRQAPSARGAPRRMLVVSMAKGRNPKRLKYSLEQVDTQYIPVEQDGSDSWKLREVVDMLQDGGVGIVPTDTVYALVCDVDNHKAVQRMYNIKAMDVTKQLSLLCSQFSEIDEFTLGFPATAPPGHPAPFKLAKNHLPGPYTFILPASKRLPKVCMTASCDITRTRSTVGVRMPNDPVCLALLEGFARPLLCTSVALPGKPRLEELDPASIADAFSGRVSFVLDGGVRKVQPSTVVDLTGDMPKVVRTGAGAWRDWDWTGEAEAAQEEEYLASFDAGEDDDNLEGGAGLSYFGV